MSRFKPYPAYKSSGVQWLGEVPESWTTGTLRWYATIQGGIAKGKDYEGRDTISLPYLRVANVQDGFVDLTEIKQISVLESELERYSLRTGDVLMNEGGDNDKLGRGAVWQGQVEPCLHQNHVFAIRPNDLLRSEWLAAFTGSQPARTYFFLSSKQSTNLASISASSIMSLVVPIPPVAEQTQILRFLDHETTRIDALIEEQQRLIELLKEKRQAVISRAVTKGLDATVPMKDSGVEWLGKVPAHWQVCKLSFRYSVELGKMLDEKRNTGTNKVPYLRNQDVQWGVINIDDLPLIDIGPNELERYTVRLGDLLVCEGGDVGRAAIWRHRDGKIGYQKALHRLRPESPNRDTAEFFFYSLMAAKALGVFEESDTKATISHLPAEKFRQYKFAFPPIDDQQEIAAELGSRLKRSSESISYAENTIALLQERRSVLISAAVTGKIDVRNWQPACGSSSPELAQEAV